MIEVKDLHKRFKLYRQPVDRLKEAVLRRPFHHTHHAVRGLSFQVGEGETLGIIGKNGAGKSTLLKLLTGVLLPDRGEISLTGKVTGLLELGTGFDVNLSGNDNITANGLLLGMTQAEVESRRQAIIAFSELGAYIDEPLRSYSSGMVMRLGFAIAIHARPAIFVVDEALSVGDAYFQQKCMRKIREFRQGGGIILFVSHDLNAIKMLSDNVLVLNEGRAAYCGDPDTAVNHYNRLIAAMTDQSATDEPHGGFGNGKARIKHASLKGEDSGGEVIQSGETLLIDLTIEAEKDIADLTAGFLIRDRFGQDMHGTNNHALQERISIKRDKILQLCFEVVIDLCPGKYSVSLALHSDENHLHECFHWQDNRLKFEVAGIKGPVFAGLCGLSSSIRHIA